MATNAPGTASRPDAPRAGSDAIRTSDVSPRQERLLSEISHELGNYFHKLYYWAELLREQRPVGADVEPAMLLETTIRDLETFLKTALEFFRPISVVPMTMSLDDLAASIRALVTRHVEPAAVQWEVEPSGGPATAAIDPGRFSFVLEGLVRRLSAPEGAVVTADMRTQSGTGSPMFVLTLGVRGGERAAGASVGATIEWAIIERIVELHGGTVDATTAGTERSVRLRVPIRS